jgi:hypothetical protein
MATGTPRHVWVDGAAGGTLITAAKLNELEQDTADALATALGGGAVSSVNGRTGAVTGLAEATALTDKADANHTHPADSATLPTTLLHRVVHNGTSYPARPAGVAAGYVDYVGPTQPTTWLAGDTWTNTA